MKLSQITASSQDYLEAILELSKYDSAVRSVDVANALQVSRASVTKAMGVLKEMGLADHEKYGTITLTDEGKRIAKSVKKRHEALKGFLVEVLGVKENAAEEEACKMEHVISPETLELLEAFIQTYHKK